MRLLAIGLGLWVLAVALAIGGFLAGEVTERHARLVQDCSQLGLVLAVVSFAVLLAAPRAVSRPAFVLHVVCGVAVVAVETVALGKAYASGPFDGIAWGGLAFTLALATAAIGAVARPLARRVAAAVAVALVACVSIATVCWLWAFDSRGYAWTTVAY